ncbi:Formate dehydrogenase chain D [Bathymodiolus heckerae thiotrophic gill symbiont]|uniref:formate dehydrogenase accessory sulfurtransferase FdhD n=1 Tax=Bathymodiolus heckerae thiotrophic gill symbiont TaxID=1052212 RepID=UPI0010AF4BCB|nr:formate dehydrogenase accessory sulfurtransferase FdhD [Bathymodiolus heckerae thiotrophic gill symbiont]CAC9588555.1 Sulfur carrier protein FdhD [uncultured Gammaproteobacteria bacterium]SHN90762.1 Formate dehydrogenase chain D [Bathymodiolus heckerae thiotrophic gill symbiont]
MLDLSQANLPLTFKTTVINEKNHQSDVHISAERPLVIFIDDQEIVTLMTLGMSPEALVLGYLKNQHLIESMDELLSIKVNWDTEKALVVSKNGIKNLSKKISKRIITTGCGQGTIFSCSIDKVYHAQLSTTKITQSAIYTLLENLNTYNEIYKSAGAVHSCALCQNTEVLIAIEDVGRHNAADIISGLMWLDNLNHKDFIFYTTGRITSEIVMKIAQMGISIILSRSGVTQMGLEIAENIGMMIIARAKGRHFLLFSGADRLIFDQQQ